MNEHVSVRLKADFDARVEHKQKLLRRWASSGIPYVLDDRNQKVFNQDGTALLDYFPDSEKAFCLWTKEHNCASTLAAYPELESFRSVSRDTLTRDYHSVLRKKVVECIEAASKRFAAQLARANVKGELKSEIRALKKELEYWKLMAIEANNDVVHQRRVSARMETLLRESEQARENNKNVLNDEIERLKALNATLASQIATISPLKGGKRA